MLAQKVTRISNLALKNVYAIVFRGRLVSWR